MKKTVILIGFIIIAILTSAAYLLFATKNEKEGNYSNPVIEISGKGKTKKPENNNLATSVKEHKTSPAPDKLSPAPEVDPNIPDLQGKPEPLKTLLDPRKDDTERNEAANTLRASGYKGLTDDLITVLNNPNEKARFRSFAVQHLYNNYTAVQNKLK